MEARVPAGALRYTAPRHRAHSSSGLGHRPLTAAARVRIPYGPYRCARSHGFGFTPCAGRVSFASKGRVVHHSVHTRTRGTVAAVRVAGVAAGQRVAKTDPSVKEHPGCWVSVVGMGMTASTSLVALASMTHTDGQNITRTIHVGQWVAADDPLVTLHPHSFGLIRER
jgi:hypothetical protein